MNKYIYTTLVVSSFHELYTRFVDVASGKQD